MRPLLSHSSAVILAILLGLPSLAQATSILFDFNPLAASVKSADGPDPIETYMESLYGSDITVALGAQTRKNRIEGRPAGAYLGNSDGALARGPCVFFPPCHPDPKDTFLINRWNAGGLPPNVRDRISITFEQVPISSVEFDWQIFPVTEKGQNADLTVMADETIIFFHALFGADKELGDLGHFSFVFPKPVRTLQFIDWSDAPIGIDNLRVQQAPTPSTLLFFGAGLAAWGFRSRRCA